MHAAPTISSTSARDDTAHTQPPPARLWASVLRLPVSLRSVSLRPVSLRSVSLRPVSLRPVSLRPVSLRSVSLRPVSLRPVSLRPVSLRPVSLRSVSLRSVSLRPVWRVLVWLLIGWLLASLLLGCSKERTSIANQDEAPAFELELLSGGTIALEELRGQVVALRFWADWCTFCRREMRELEPVYQQLRAQGLEILAVNVGQERGRVERFSARIPYSYPTLLDPDSTVARRYGVHAIPMTFLIDRQGIVRGRILGESNPATFERMVLPLLNDAA